MPGIYKSFSTKIEAQRFELEQKALLKSGQHVIKRTLAEALERYSHEIAPQHKGQRWEQMRIAKLQRDAIADDYVDLITSDDIEHWIKLRKDQGLADGSILRELTILRSVFRECVRWRYCLTNPVNDARKPKEPKGRNRRISNDEIMRICDALGYSPEKSVSKAQQAVAVAFLLAIETGMRQGEIYGLTWDNVNLQDGYVYLPVTKNGDDRHVPLTERAVELIEQMQTAKEGERVFPYNQSSAGTLFRRALQLAQITDLRFHDARHEACSRMAQLEGMDPLALGKIIGHRDPRSLMIYFNPHASELVNAVRSKPKW
ncbi:tyrosine-type recombinase/integrase [Rappaport israeli]|uniref:tyrosine-type recombinase/integrase n=1 Tax=Rappaport israeli TaxID=1839807 RepID=UPI000930E2CD|nr:site-specific integrase [Rappaport israeli]